MGVWDTLAHGEWRQRNAALLVCFGSPRSLNRHKPRCVLIWVFGGMMTSGTIAGLRLILRDADVDGNPEEFPDGVFTRKINDWEC